MTKNICGGKKCYLCEENTWQRQAEWYTNKLREPMLKCTDISFNSERLSDWRQENLTCKIVPRNAENF